MSSIDYGIDYSNIQRKTPKYIKKPKTEGELIEIINYCNEKSLQFTTRGHACSSNELVITDCMLIDMTQMDQVDIQPSGLVSLGAGARWFDAQKTLIERGLDFVVLTGNPYATVGGTLSCGGFGSASINYGAQIESVVSLKVLSADGKIHTTYLGEDLFNFTLAGLGQLSIIVSATVKTKTYPSKTYKGKKEFQYGSRIADISREIIDYKPDHCSLTYDLHRGTWLASLAFEQQTQPDTRILETPDISTNYPFEQAMRLYSYVEGLANKLVINKNIDDISDCARVWVDFMLPIDVVDSFFNNLLSDLKNLPHTPSLYCSILPNINKMSKDLPLTPKPKKTTVLSLGVYFQIPRSEISTYRNFVYSFQKECCNIGGKIYLYGDHIKSADFYISQFGKETYEKWKCLKKRYDPNGIINSNINVLLGD